MVRNRLLRPALAVVAATILLDLAITLLLLEDGGLRDRALPPFGAITNPGQREWLERQRAELEVPPDRRGPGVFDRELGWTHRPDFQSRDGRFRFNSIAARGGREYEATRPQGTYRVICFGDSFTHCDQVADEDTWQAQLEGLDSRVEALNFGVGGYGTDQALLRFRRIGRFDADAVLIGILLENVGRNVNRYRPLWYPRSRSTGAKPRFVLEDGSLRIVPLPIANRRELLDTVEDGSIIARLAEREYWTTGDPGLLSRSSLVRLAHGYFAYRARDVRRLVLDAEGEPYRVTLAILQAFHREALASGAREAVVLIFPREGDLQGLLRGDRYWSGLLADLAAAGIPALDMAERLRNLEPVEDEAQIYARGHLTAEGNRSVAVALAEWIADRQPGRR